MRMLEVMGPHARVSTWGRRSGFPGHFFGNESSRAISCPAPK